MFEVRETFEIPGPNPFHRCGRQQCSSLKGTQLLRKPRGFFKFLRTFQRRFDAVLGWATLPAPAPARDSPRELWTATHEDGLSHRRPGFCAVRGRCCVRRERADNGKQVTSGQP